MTSPSDDSLARFEALVNAALTLGLAGLDGDPVNTRLLIPGADIVFQVPYTNNPATAERTCMLLSGLRYKKGALWQIIREICQKSGAVAPYHGITPANYLATQCKLVHFGGPRVASAHEVVQSTALLAEALARWGNRPARIERLLKPA